MSIKKTYIVCATMRSGSSLLCNLLEKTQCAGKPREFLRDRLRDDSTLSDEEYIEFVRNKLTTNASTNGVSGVKLMWWNLDAMLKRIRRALKVSDAMSDGELLEQVFPNTKFIWITRRDKLAQSISLCRAEKTKVWKKDSSENVRTRFSLPRITDFHISRNLNLIEKWENSWQEFFKANSIPVYTIVYEDMLSDYETYISQILNFLEISEDIDNIPVPDLKKQADFYNSFLAIRYKLYLGLIKILPDSFIRLLNSLKFKLKQTLSNS